jgi:hypothetical protein
MEGYDTNGRSELLCGMDGAQAHLIDTATTLRDSSVRLWAWLYLGPLQYLGVHRCFGVANDDSF